jgi:predicted nucleic acid-binding Zn ribbon protein
MKAQVREKWQKKWRNVYRKPGDTANCTVCGKEFSHVTRITCSDKCHSEHLRLLYTPEQRRAKQLEVIDSMRQANKTSIFAALATVGHDEDFEPVPTADFMPTSHAAGSEEKIAVLRERVQLGQPLWHPDDPVYRDVPAASEGLESVKIVFASGKRRFE